MYHHTCLFAAYFAFHSIFFWINQYLDHLFFLISCFPPCSHLLKSSALWVPAAWGPPRVGGKHEYSQPRGNNEHKGRCLTPFGGERHDCHSYLPITAEAWISHCYCYCTRNFVLVSAKTWTCHWKNGRIFATYLRVKYRDYLPARWGECCLYKQLRPNKRGHVCLFTYVSTDLYLTLDVSQQCMPVCIHILGKYACFRASWLSVMYACVKYMPVCIHTHTC